MGRLFYWGPWYPIDVIKSTMMGDKYQKDERKYHGFVDTAKKVYAQGGSVHCTIRMHDSLLMSHCPQHQGLLPRLHPLHGPRLSRHVHGVTQA